MSAASGVQEMPAVDLGALLDAGDGAVVTLVAGETRLVAHKAVLAARSPTLAAIFQHETPEASITDVEGPVLRQLLAYCYTLQAPQLPCMPQQLLAAAGKYGLSGLKDAWEQQAARQLTVENATATAVLALSQSCPSLKEAAVAFIRDHMHQVMVTQGWKDAVVSHPQFVVELTHLIAQPPEETRTPDTAEGGPTPGFHDQSQGGPTPGFHDQPQGGPTPGFHDQPQGGPTPGFHDQPHSSHGRWTPAAAATATAPHHTPRILRGAGSWLHRGPVVGGRWPRASHSSRGRVGVSRPLGARAGVGFPTVLPSQLIRESHFHQHPVLAQQGSLRMPVTATPSIHSQSPSSQTSAGAAASATRHEEEPLIFPIDKLMKAAKEGAVDQLQTLLITGVGVGARDENGMTALHWAAREGREAAARFLLAAGARADAKANTQTTPLHLAAGNGNAAVVRLLLDVSADPNVAVGARDENGMTALHWAVREGRDAVVRLLLDVSADPNVAVGARDGNMMTALHWAASEGREAAARWLLAAGAEVDAEAHEQTRPLHLAAGNGHAGVVRLLLDASADPNAKTKWGRTPLYIAKHYRRKDAVSALLEGGADEGATK